MSRTRPKLTAVIVYCQRDKNDRDWKDYLKQLLLREFAGGVDVVGVGQTNVPPPTEARRNVSTCARSTTGPGVLIVILSPEHLRYVLETPSLDHRQALFSNALSFAPENAFLVCLEQVDFRRTDSGGVPLEKRFEGFSRWRRVQHDRVEELVRGIRGTLERIATPRPTLKARLASEAVKCDESTNVTVIFDKELPANPVVQAYLSFPGNPKNFQVETKVCNPYVAVFKTIEHVEGEVRVQVMVNGEEVALESPGLLRYCSSGSELGAVSQFYVEILEALISGGRGRGGGKGGGRGGVGLVGSGTSTEVMDGLVSSVFKSSHVPAQAFEYLFSLAPDQQGEADSEFPTLLHFGASKGLKNFCSILYDLPNAHCALEKRNKRGKMPEEMAAEGGHTDLASFLEDSREGNFNDMYINSVRKTNINDADDIYIKSRVDYLKCKGKSESKKGVQFRDSEEKERNPPTRMSKELANLIRQFTGQEVNLTMTEMEFKKFKSHYIGMCKNFDEKQKTAKQLREEIENAKKKMEFEIYETVR